MIGSLATEWSTAKHHFLRASANEATEAAAGDETVRDTVSVIKPTFLD